MNEQMRIDFKAYLDPDGLVSDQVFPNRGSSGNLILYTAEAVWTFERRKELSYSDVLAFKSALSKCEAEPGLYWRTPGNLSQSDNQEGPDDIIGITSLTSIQPNHFPYAKEWLAYGRSHKVQIRAALLLGGHPVLAFLFGWISLRYVFNQCMPETLTIIKAGSNRVTPNWGAWFGRYPAIIAHAQFAAGEKFPQYRLILGPAIGLACLYWVRHANFWFSTVIIAINIPLMFITILGFRRIYWAISVFIAGRGKQKDETDPWILTWIMVQTYIEAKGACLLCDWAARNFKKRLFHAKPGGLNTVFLAYWGARHPITNWFLS